MSDLILDIKLSNMPNNDTVTVDLTRDEMREIVKAMKTAGKPNKTRRFLQLFNEFVRQADAMRRVADRLEGKK